MKVADWVPVFVAVVTLITVLVSGGFAGGAGKRQLSALKVIQEAALKSKDGASSELLIEAERHLAVRIEARYRPFPRKVRTAYFGLVGAALIVIGLVGILTVTIPGLRDQWPTSLALIIFIVALGAEVIVLWTLDVRKLQAGSDEYVAAIGERVDRILERIRQDDVD